LPGRPPGQRGLRVAFRRSPWECVPEAGVRRGEVGRFRGYGLRGYGIPCGGRVRRPSVESADGGMAEVESYAERFIASLRHSARTKVEYARDLGLFVAWAAGNGKNDPRRVSAADIEDFLASLRRRDGRPYSAAGRNRVLAVVKGFYKFLVRDRVLTADEDPAARVPTERRPKRSPVFLELDEGARLILAVQRRPATTARDRVLQARDMAILTLLLGSGLRVSELVSLNVDGWREAMLNGWLTVVGKGDKERVVPPSDEAVEYVERYLRVRPDVPPDEQGNPLFVSRKLGRLSAVQIERRVRELARAAGIKDKKVTPHKLRATWVTQLLISGANIREVQRMAGHESLDTTMIYAGVRDNEELRRTVKKHQVRYL